MTDKWELSIRAFSRVKSVPTEMGSPLIVQYVEDGASLVSQWTGRSIDLTDIGSAFHPALTAFAAAQINAYKEGVGISYELGTLQVEKDTELEGASRQLAHEVSMFNLGLKMLGRSFTVDNTVPNE